MSNHLYHCAIFLASMSGGLSLSNLACANSNLPNDNLEEVRIWGTSVNSRDAGYTSANSILLPEDMQAINATTTEDLVKFEPSLVIRRRFIGDSNGTLGLRGSNMFQTARSMVFADGVPLHYLLQSRWNGAPRWTMVSASEIEKVEVLYGPFSAEYSGNAMGGVVLIETGTPQEQELHVDISHITQQFAAYGFDDNLNGHKSFISYGNKTGGFSYYLSWNHLDNQAHPQTFRGAAPDAAAPASPTPVTGSLYGLDARARSRVWYGDTGVVDTTTNNYKIKLGYEWEHWQTLVNIAFEDRASENSGNSTIRDTNGNTLWSGSSLEENGRFFSFNSERINHNLLDRESLSIGLRVKGSLSQQHQLELNLNQFDIRKDARAASKLNPLDPAYTTDGEVTAYDNSGWRTAEAKLRSQFNWLNGLEVVTGLRVESYELNLNQFDSPNYKNAVKGDLTSQFGGQTDIQALFAQLNLELTTHWDISTGLRYEVFNSHGGYYSDEINSQYTVVYAPKDTQEHASPKFSVGYAPNSTWQFRYAIAKAYRFPIVEELFRQYQSYNSINLSNPDLRPENGTHHNLMAERQLTNGYIRVNLFHETVKNAIESQSTTTNDGVSLSTFVPLDETQATGLEFIVNQYDIFDHLDIRFNLTYTEAEIIENQANPEWEGNEFPRIPKWRSNLLALYNITDQWNLGVNAQYASDVYGRIQNDDTIDNVYGAQDSYTRIGLKSRYQFNQHVQASVGIDNITNEIAYVAHPWPGRTLYFNLSYDL